MAVWHKEKGGGGQGSCKEKTLFLRLEKGSIALKDLKGVGGGVKGFNGNAIKKEPKILILLWLPIANLKNTLF